MSRDTALAVALAAFLDSCRIERGLSAHTVSAYSGDLARFVEHAARSGVDAPGGLGRERVSEFLASLARQGIGPRSPLPSRSSRCDVRAWLQREGLLKHDILIGVHAPKQQRPPAAHAASRRDARLVDSARGDGPLPARSRHARTRLLSGLRRSGERHAARLARSKAGRGAYSAKACASGSCRSANRRCAQSSAGWRRDGRCCASRASLERCVVPRIAAAR